MSLGTSGCLKFKVTCHSLPRILGSCSKPAAATSPELFQVLSIARNNSGGHNVESIPPPSSLSIIQVNCTFCDFNRSSEPSHTFAMASTGVNVRPYSLSSRAPNGRGPFNSTSIKHHGHISTWIKDQSLVERIHEHKLTRP